jgi:hypothetical protein
LVTLTSEAPLTSPKVPLAEAPVKIQKKRGRKPKPKPLPEDGFKIVFGEFIIDFNQ